MKCNKQAGTGQKQTDSCRDTELVIAVFNVTGVFYIILTGSSKLNFIFAFPSSSIYPCIYFGFELSRFCMSEVSASLFKTLGKN